MLSYDPSRRCKSFSYPFAARGSAVELISVGLSISTESPGAKVDSNGPRLL